MIREIVMLVQMSYLSSNIVYNSSVPLRGNEGLLLLGLPTHSSQRMLQLVANCNEYSRLFSQSCLCWKIFNTLCIR